MDSGASDKYHSMWRLESINNRRGSLSPEIYESVFLESVKSFRPRRLILTACDYKFFSKHCKNVIDYEKSGCQAVYVLGVFSHKKESEGIIQKLYQFSVQNNLKKFCPFVYGNSNLEWILDQQQDPEIRWDYKINYIRSSRYNLVKKVWKALGISMTADATIGDSSTYLIDFDNEIKGDINHAIKKKYSGQSLVLSWD